jgi:hypothetical protein
MQDAAHHGDRTLSLFWTADGSLTFGSYTSKEQDAIEFVDRSFSVPLPAQQLWTYVYFGYEGATQSLYARLQSDGVPQTEFNFNALHYTGRYFGLYMGRDGLN